MKVPQLKEIKEIACGLWHVLALDMSGVVFSCGSNKHGECGHAGGSGEGFQAIESAPMNHVSAGMGVSFFVDQKDMRLHSCGNTSLSLQKSEKNVPTLVSSFKETVKMVDVA